MAFSCRCTICHKELKSSSEQSRGRCARCMNKRADASSTLASVALIAVGAAVGFVGGYVASLWSNNDTKTCNDTETKQNDKIDPTIMFDPDDDIASCPICYDRRVNIALTPCGHTLCKECTEELPNKICPMCSKNITNQQTIYIN